MTVKEIGEAAKAAEVTLSITTNDERNAALAAISKQLIADMDEILAANAIDLENGKKAGLSASMLDRLMLNAARVTSIADAVLDVAKLPDPLGEEKYRYEHPKGMRITAVSVPIGVIGIIFEARPNVTVDAAVLCLKSGNAVILRGGKEAINSNKAFAKSMRAALASVGFDENCVQLIEDTTRRSSYELMTLTDCLDLLIPRGGAGLIRAVVDNAKVPVIETGTGNCHAYVDKAADLDMAADIIFNAKTSRPSVCNALETMLIHKDVAESFLPLVKSRLDEKDVVIYGDAESRRILGDSVILADDDDYKYEFLDYKIACKVVDDIDAALAHIRKYSSGHSECIVTSDEAAAERFLREVDAAAVYVNASTRFTDGGEFGFGAEIGISTQKIHARGPMGLKQLTSYKYLIRGNGQIR